MLRVPAAMSLNNVFSLKMNNGSGQGAEPTLRKRRESDMAL